MSNPSEDIASATNSTNGSSIPKDEFDECWSSLPRERELLKALMSNASDFIYFKDLQSRFIRISKSMATLFNLNGPEEAIGKSDFDFFAPEHAQDAFETEQNIIANGNPMIGVVEKETWPDGRISWVSTTKIPLRNESGSIIGTFGVSRDVTAAKEAEGELRYEHEMFNIFLESVPARIYFKDTLSRYVRCSNAMIVELGLSEHDAIVGKTDMDFFSEEYAKKTFDNEQRIMSSNLPEIGVVEKECWPDGKTSWALTTKMPWRARSGDVLGTLGVTKDLTYLKRAEKEIEQINKKLLHTSRQAGMAEIATGVLHNVGNVINSANMSVTLLEDSIKQSKAGKIGRIADMLQEHADDLANFMTTDDRGIQIPNYLTKLAKRISIEQDGVLSEIKVLSEKIDHIKEIVTVQQNYAHVSGVEETLNLRDLVEDALRIHTGAFARHHVSIVRVFENLPEVKVDKHRLLQILVNLLHNAKYACDEAEGEKTVTVRIESPDNDKVRIEVSDTGVGISRENLTKIFAHGFTTREGGHGFGLHNCSLGADALNGTLTAYSGGQGLGAKFTLEIPKNGRSSK